MELLYTYIFFLNQINAPIEYILLTFSILASREDTIFAQEFFIYFFFFMFALIQKVNELCC